MAFCFGVISSPPGGELISISAACLNLLPWVVVTELFFFFFWRSDMHFECRDFHPAEVGAYLRTGDLPIALHSIYPPYFLRASPPPQPQCSSSVSLPPSWLSVSSIITARSNRWSLTSPVVLAVASTLASPVPANSLSKKEVVVRTEPEPLNPCPGPNRKNCV